MRIAKISVKGLFGYLDHEIPLNQESRITIIHGPNGVGKTVLMRMVHGLLNYDYEYIASIPFEQFEIEYSGGGVLTVGKGLKSDDEDEFSTLIINYINETGETQSPFTVTIPALKFLNKKIIEMRPELSPIYHSGELYWASGVDKRKDKKNPGTDLILEILGHAERLYSKAELLYTNADLHTEVYGELPEWFRSIQSSASQKLISTMRLQEQVEHEQVIKASKLYFKKKRKERPIAFFPGLLSTINAVEDYFAGFSLAEDDLMEAAADHYYLESEIKELYDLLVKDPYEAGRIGAKERIEELEIELAQSQHSERQHEYEYQNAKELCELANARLVFKSFQLDDEYYSIHLVSQDGAPIPLSALSSGEQHLLVLYYQLLFDIEPNTLVMIDEPELSMNVVWQRNFLKDLQRIIELRKFDILIATHSPQIIHDKWDWMVPLGEKVDD